MIGSKIKINGTDPVPKYKKSLEQLKLDLYDWPVVKLDL
jgi:hypothetical protein